eukprot:gnl/TRDRNA2_/TRDRNA2_176588_c1_seq2.p1 gnl/TRDRNA2_/TRDRNA2_176588_c1~~gnl/TRDRNA2_/TRDRNA2_176588_c1_seq2.p1  ORF type:complete len:250 (+),score=72.83 gnl/TRDRNA2_/TRDRNA2_176588_c1_seq2:102-851(+)
MASETECKLFLGGLSPEVSSDDIWNHFTKYGNVVDAVAMYKDGKARGFGFVTFDNPQSAMMAVSEQQVIKNCNIDTKSCVKKGEAPPPQGKAAMREMQQQSKIFVGGLAATTTQEMLYAHFAQYGNLTDCVVMVGPDGTPRGFGFVTYDNPTTAQIVLGQPQMLDGKTLECKSAVRDESKGKGWGKSGGKGGGGGGEDPAQMMQMMAMMMGMMGKMGGGKGGGGPMTFGKSKARLMSEEIRQKTPENEE